MTIIPCFLPATYLRNMEEKLTQNKLILKEELKTLLHLSDSRDDMELVKNVIYRWGISLEFCQLWFLLTLFFSLNNLIHLTRFQLSPVHWWLLNLLSTCLHWAPDIYIHLSNTYWIPSMCQVLRIENQNSCLKKSPAWWTLLLCPLGLHIQIASFCSVFCCTDHSGQILGSLFPLISFALLPDRIRNPTASTSLVSLISSLPLSALITSVLVQASSYLIWITSVDSWLGSLLLAYAYYVPLSLIPCQFLMSGELTGNHSLLLGNPAKVSLTQEVYDVKSTGFISEIKFMAFLFFN